MEEHCMNNQTGKSIRTGVRAGTLYNSAEGFNTVLLDRLINSSCATDILNQVNEWCKKETGNGPQCDEWAAQAGIRFARG
jgi:hypothetical protein